MYPQIPEETIQRGLKKVKHACRFQYIESESLLIDGSHNPNGAIALREGLDFYFPDKKRKFVFGALSNKDYKKMMEILFEKNDEIYLNHFSHKASATFEELRNACPYDCQKFVSLEQIKKDPHSLIIICGSFYMINEIITPDYFD